MPLFSIFYGDKKAESESDSENDIQSTPEDNKQKDEPEYQYSERTGHSTITFPDGSVYVGKTSIDKKRNGHGKITYKDGSMYEGNWHNDMYDGDGVYTDKYGGNYNGQFKNGLYEGRGTYKYNDGNIYAGDWVFGKRHGNGKIIYGENNKDGERISRHPYHYIFKNGEYYDGEWKEDMKCGHGKNVYNNGYYIGKFLNNAKHGNGMYVETSKNKTIKYEGEFVLGDITGEGMIYKNDIKIYEGFLELDVPQIKGKFYKDDGSFIYSGQIKAGVYHGFGKMYIDGMYVTGVFDDGYCKQVYKIEQD